MSNDIQWAKQILEKNGYIVARVAYSYDGYSDWREEAVRLDDKYVAFLLEPKWQRSPDRRNYVKQVTCTWIKPNKLCEVLGIDRHTLARKLKHKNCPRGIAQREFADKNAGTRAPARA